MAFPHNERGNVIQCTDLLKKAAFFFSTKKQMEFIRCKSEKKKMLSASSCEKLWVGHSPISKVLPQFLADTEGHFEFFDDFDSITHFATFIMFFTNLIFASPHNQILNILLLKQAFALTEKVLFGFVARVKNE